MSGSGQESTIAKADLVLLLRGLEDVDDPLALRDMVCRKFYKNLPICKGKGTSTAEFLAASSPDIFIQLDGFLFHVLIVPGPFFEDREAVAEQMGELRLRQAVLDHQAYLRVHLLAFPENATVQKAAGMIGKMTAALGGSPAALAVVSPFLQQVRLWDQNIRKALCRQHPLTALTETPPSKVPVVPGDADDADVRAATDEARRRWPQFANAYAVKRPDQIFAVKMPFQDREFIEFMWIKILKIEDEYLQGIIDNDPVNLKKYKRGMRVRVRVKALTDWMYTDGDRLIGGFTNEALGAAQRERGVRGRGQHDEERPIYTFHAADRAAAAEAKASSRPLRRFLGIAAVLLLCGLGIGLALWLLHY